MAADARDAAYQLKPGFHTPSRTAAIGMYLFLAALFMLFASGMLGYGMIRVAAMNKVALHSLHMPGGLWFSTALVVAASVTAQLALREVKREHQESFRRWLAATLWLAVGFVIVQIPSLVVLLREQAVMKQQKLALFGLIFFLVLLHAMHVVGGIAALGRTVRQAGRNVYDHEHYQPVHHVALYWHFLDCVWLVMFFSFLLVG